MNFLDYSIVFIVLYYVGMGLYKGFIKSVFSTVGLIAGFIMAYQFSTEISSLLKKFIPMEHGSEKISFILVIVCVYLLFHVLGNLLTKGAKIVALGSLNSILGGFVGVLKAIMALLILTFAYTYFLELSGMAKPEIAETSMILPKLTAILHFFLSL